MSILVDGATRVMVQGITGSQARRHVAYMRAYGTSVACGVSPGRGGEVVEGVPVYDTVREALTHHAVDLSLLFLAAPRVLDGALEAIDGPVPALMIHEDGVPLHDVVQVLTAAGAASVRVIGPNAQGIVSPGKAKVGGSGGSQPERVFLPGSVGVASRSGGMGIELCLDLTRHGVGQSTYVSLGGDPYVGTTFRDVLALFARDPETRCVLLFGELGTRQEEEAAEFLAAGGCPKPVVAYLAGEALERLPRGMNFGHTRALLGTGEGSVAEKKAALRAAGVVVADRLAEVVPLVRQALDSA